MALEDKVICRSNVSYHSGSCCLLPLAHHTSWLLQMIPTLDFLSELNEKVMEEKWSRPTCVLSSNNHLLILVEAFEKFNFESPIFLFFWYAWFCLIPLDRVAPLLYTWLHMSHLMTILLQANTHINVQQELKDVKLWQVRIRVCILSKHAYLLCFIEVSIRLPSY